jgi:hypothetical protein
MACSTPHLDHRLQPDERSGPDLQKFGRPAAKQVRLQPA